MLGHLLLIHFSSLIILVDIQNAQDLMIHTIKRKLHCEKKRETASYRIVDIV